MKVTGLLKVKYDTQHVSDKFKKREFVLTIEPTSPYPQNVLFQLTQDKCSLIDNKKVGDTLEVSFNLRGREWTSPQGETKYFNTIDAWAVYKTGETGTQSTANSSSQNDDDLPF
jgi:hypothetical protein